jgi:hypothetical protein
MASDPESKSKAQTLAQIRVNLAQGNGAARKRRKLDQTEKNRAEKLKDIVKRLKAGEHVQNRMLKTWLTAEEFEAIGTSWELEKNYRADVFHKPDAVIKYEALLKRADFLYYKADALNLRGKKSNMNAADGAYERALEHLQEQLSLDSTLHGWFDRDLNFGHGSMLGLDPDSVPRCVTSRSINRQVGQSHEKRTIGDIKLQVVQKALDDLIFEVTASNGQSQKLKSLLQLPSDDLGF